MSYRFDFLWVEVVKTEKPLVFENPVLSWDRHAKVVCGIYFELGPRAYLALHDENGGID